MPISSLVSESAGQVQGGVKGAYVHLAFYGETCGMIRNEEGHGLLDFRTSKHRKVLYFKNKTITVLDRGRHFSTLDRGRGKRLSQADTTSEL